MRPSEDERKHADIPFREIGLGWFPAAMILLYFGLIIVNNIK